MNIIKNLNLKSFKYTAQSYGIKRIVLEDE